jgi:glycosyltransferase involved in cell wall biosynthesis
MLARAVDLVRVNDARFVLLNGVELAPLARLLREKLGDKYRIVLLSYGLESADYLHTLRSADRTVPFAKTTRAELLRLGRQLVTECMQRQDIDHVLCLAPFEAEIERWLGAKNVDWLPRTIPGRSLDWQPNPMRLGFVGTVDHPPNREGLELFLEALEPLAPPGIRLRVVGGPPTAAEAFVRRFSRVDYLGPLSDEELEDEARTWSCFVHPLFCYARGCSTKLATALGWRIPVVTTPAGCRGYVWREGRLPLADTPRDLAALALSLLDERAARGAAREVAAAAESSPTLAEVADRIRGILLPSPGGLKSGCHVA